MQLRVEEEEEVVVVSVGLVVTLISRYIDRARPMTSNPGPGHVMLVLVLHLTVAGKVVTDIGGGAWHL